MPLGQLQAAYPRALEQSPECPLGFPQLQAPPSDERFPL
jgi:hypothetical protein